MRDIKNATKHKQVDIRVAFLSISVVTLSADVFQSSRVVG